MADNTTLNTGAGGDTIRTIARSAVKTQVVALDVGGEAGPESLVTSGNALPVSGSVSISNFPATQPVSGTVTTSPPANASTNVTQFGGTNVSTGTGVGGVGIPRVTVSSDSFPASQTVAGTVTANQGTANSLANAWATKITDATNGPAAVKAASTAAVATDPALVVAVSPNNSVAVTGTFFQGTQPVSIAGTVAENLTQVASTTLGTPQTFGTAPSGVVIGTSSDLYVAGTRARSNQTTTAAGVQDVNVVGSLGVTNSVTNGTFTAITDNTTKVGVIVGTTALKTDMSSVAGTATSTAAAGTQKVGITGSAAAVLDSVTTAATTPANALAVSVANVTTAPSLTTGQSVALQGDYQGSVFVKPYRRGQTVGKSTTISSTTATAIVAAPSAGIFADLASLVITVTPQSTTGEAFTVTVSDGTVSYIFDMFTGVSATLASQPITLTFNPPIPATTAATAWNATVSAVTTQPTIHVTTVAILQKAS